MRIDHYAFGNIVIDGRTYTKDVIIFPDRVLSPWWRKEGHLLQMEDLKEVVSAKPSHLVIGKGFSGIMDVPGEVIRSLEGSGIKISVAKTTEAVDIFNSLGGKKIAALHLTC